MNDLFEYKQELDALRFTPEQKTQLAAATVAAAQKQTRRVRRPIGRTVLAAACITAVLAVSAGASGVLKNAAEVFAPIFGGTAAQTEVIDKIGYPIGASATDNGVTISADAIMGDEYNAAIVFTFTRDDGTALLPEGVEDPMLLVGGTQAYTVVWDLGDVGIGLMTIFNMLALVPLSGEALAALNDYEMRKKIK